VPHLTKAHTCGASHRSSRHQHQQLWRELDATTAPPAIWTLASGHLLAPRLGRYCLIGQEGGNAVKLLSGWPRSPPRRLQSSAEFCLRLHVLPDTPDALGAGAADRGAERPAPGWWTRRGSWLFATGGQQLCFSIEELSLGWRSKSKYQRDPFAHVWSGGQAGLHCASAWSTWTRLDRSTRITIYNSRQVVHIVSSKNDLPGSRSPLCPSTFHAGLKSSWNSRDPPQTVFKTPAQTPWRHLSITRRAQLPRGSDWRMLGRLLAWSGWLGSCAGRPSPTDCLLDLN
uniref:UPA domain-containing protein n=1 Tax=Macrostomum lignano TaxID=282301 RepID=A0A1I8FAV0_9PLAT